MAGEDNDGGEGQHTGGASQADEELLQGGYAHSIHARSQASRVLIPDFLSGKDDGGGGEQHGGGAGTAGGEGRLPALPARGRRRPLRQVVSALITRLLMRA